MRPEPWSPPVELSPAERAIVQRIRRAKLFAFLRERRHELLDAAFQEELAGPYAGSGLGRPPVSPAQLALATVVQAYVGCSDDEAIEATTMDRRWQLGLDCPDASRPPFGKGTLVALRRRPIGLAIYCKAWPVRNGDRSPKTAFALDWERSTIRCPSGTVLPFEPGGTVRVPAATCAACPLRDRYTTRAHGRGVAAHPGERRLVGLRQRQTTPAGRAKLSERVAVEHVLAHVGRWQGRRARYRGARKALFDLRRCAVVHDLHVLARLPQPNVARPPDRCSSASPRCSSSIVVLSAARIYGPAGRQRSCAPCRDSFASLRTGSSLRSG